MLELWVDDEVGVTTSIGVDQEVMR